MAHWVYRAPKASIILTPKVASRSLVAALEGCKNIKFCQDERFAVCIRHPLDRIAAAKAHKETWKIIQRQQKKGRLTDHEAPQVDYINYRIKGATKTHGKVPVGASELIIKPDFVFVYENLPDSYYQLMAFLGLEPKELPHKNAHKRGRDYREVLGDDLPKYEKLYAKDMEFWRGHAKGIHRLG